VGVPAEHGVVFAGGGQSCGDFRVMREGNVTLPNLQFANRIVEGHISRRAGNLHQQEHITVIVAGYTVDGAAEGIGTLLPAEGSAEIAQEDELRRIFRQQIQRLLQVPDIIVTV